METQLNKKNEDRPQADCSALGVRCMVILTMLVVVAVLSLILLSDMVDGFQGSLANAKKLIWLAAIGALRNNALTSDRKNAYPQTWASMFWIHPTCYVAVTADN